MSTENPTAQFLQDAAEEIERCLWRASNFPEGRGRDEQLEELDSEVMLALSGLDHAQRLVAMNVILVHLEQEDMPTELIEELFAHSQISRVQMDAWRLEQSTAVPAAKSVQRRI